MTNVCSLVKWTLTHCDCKLITLIIIIQLLHLATRMATLGKMGEYCSSSEEWPQYSEHLEYFLIANKVTDDVSVMGPQHLNGYGT